MIGIFIGVGEVETRYDVAELDARLALNILIRFEGVNGTMNGFSKLLLRGHRPSIVVSTDCPIVSMALLVCQYFA